MLAIIILNYMTYEMTIECVNSIIQTTKSEYKIYIVDNGSMNDSYNILSIRYEKESNIKVLGSKVNMGYAGGNNIGLKKATSDGCEFALISNNDIIYYPNVIDKLLEKIINKKCFMIGPKIVKPNGTLQLTALKTHPSFKEYIAYDTFLGMVFKRKSNNFDVLSEVYWLHGSCFIVDINLFIEIGFFDEHTFLFYEEYILAKKAYDVGYKLFYMPDIIVLHYHGATTNSVSIFAITENIKSEMYYLRNYAKWGKLKILAVWFMRNIYTDVRLIKHRKQKELFNYIKVSFNAAFCCRDDT